MLGELRIYFDFYQTNLKSYLQPWVLFFLILTKSKTSLKHSKATRTILKFTTNKILNNKTFQSIYYRKNSQNRTKNTGNDW